MIALHTPRLILRDFMQKDLEALNALFTDPQALYYLPDLFKNSIEETQAHLDACIRSIDAVPRLRFFLAIQARDGTFIGELACNVIECAPDGMHLNLGYCICPEYWNRGYASEAAQAMINYAFSNGVCRISGTCLADNIGSRRVLEKCGLIQEGLLKCHTWHDDQWKDRAIYRLLKSEWCAIAR